jgi:homoserine kinase
MKATAFAPATVANVAVGFDILGFAIKGLGETATVEKIPGTTHVILQPIDGFPGLSLDPLKNTATAGLVRLIQEKKLNFGFRVTLQKKIPVGSGLGGSATSAVAALVAANALLRKKLTKDELLDFSLTGEEVASQSRHADNIAPCLEGGLVFVNKGPDFVVQKIKTPRSLSCVILLPALSINTKDSRASLDHSVPLSLMIQQMANMAGFILGCGNSDFSMMRKFLKDVVIEPQRSGQIPYFSELQAAAMKAGALGCSISGSGPAIFALAQDSKSAIQIHRAFLKVVKDHQILIRNSWVSPISQQGASILRGKK